MEIDVYRLLKDNPLLLTFLVIGTGYLLGRLKVGSIPLGSVTGVLLAGLLFGHLGFPDRPAAATFGFALFIFSVGLQAGPSFFSAFLEDGPKYISLAVVVAVTALGLVIMLSTIFGFGFGLNAGLLAGALTSTPTLAGAQDAIKSGLANMPDGMTAEQASANLSVGYAMTYIFGTIGLILFIRYFPVFLGIDLPEQARLLAEERGYSDRKKKTGEPAAAFPLIRAYRISDSSVAGKTIGQILHERAQGRASILRVRRGDEILEADPRLELQSGDVISVIASLSAHAEAQSRVGQEVLDSDLLNYRVATHEIVVINPEACGKKLGSLDITTTYGCFVAGINRASIELAADDGVILNKGDRLLVTGEKHRLQELADRFGHIEETIEETDLLTFSFGICGGVLLGLVLVKIGEVSVGLGSAGGLLIMGILIGFLRSLHPTFGRVPAAARFVFMELGLMLFMASVGLKAGPSIVPALTSVGPTIILCGLLVTMTPVVVAYAFGRYVLHLHPVLLLGSITGAMTSTPSLKIVTSAARSPIPALGYAGTYTFANVLLTFAGTLIMTL